MRRSLVAKIIFTFVCLCIVPSALLALLFIEQSRHSTEKNMKESLEKLVQEKSQVLSLNLKQVEVEADDLSLWVAQSLSKNYDGPLPAYYRRDRRGVLGREYPGSKEDERKDAGHISSIYLPKNLPLTAQTRHDIVVTESLDPLFEHFLKVNPNVDTVYFVTDEGLMRVYPYLSNDVFAADHDQRTDSFFRVITGRNSPLMSSGAWTKPYYDYAGKGWVVTYSRPVYLDGRLRAVVCLDVSLKTLEKVTADFRLAKSGFAFLLDKEGNIIYHPDYLSLTSKQGETLRGNLLDLSFSSGYHRIIEKMVKGEQGIAEYWNPKRGTHQIVAFTPVKDLDWSMGIEVDRDDYTLGLGDSFTGLLAIGTVFLLLLAVFGTYLSLRLSEPIVRLTKDVEKITAGEFGREVAVSSEDEIGTLAHSFNLMSQKIKDYTEDIIRSKNQLETVFNSIGGLLAIIGPDYRLRMLNKHGLAHLTGSGKEMSGLACYQALAGLSGPCANCPVAETVATGEEAFGEVIIGKEIYHNWSYPIKDSKGALEEIVLYSKKVTEQVMLEQKLAQAEKMAGIGQLAAAVTHELKNPLAVIKGAAYLLPGCIAAKDEEAFGETVAAINESVSRAEKIIYNLLDFSRPAQGKAEYLEAKGLLEQILLLERESIVKQRIQVTIEMEPEDLKIFGLTDSLKHIFLNIITNAVQAMPSGGKLEIEGRLLHGGGKELTELVFRDTGCGITDDFRDKIFEPFVTTKEAKKGTGLGLWIVRREIERLGGTIKFQSVPERGTVFTVTLPAKRRGEEM